MKRKEILREGVGGASLRFFFVSLSGIISMASYSEFSIGWPLRGKQKLKRPFSPYPHDSFKNEPPSLWWQQHSRVSTKRFFVLPELGHDSYPMVYEQFKQFYRQEPSEANVKCRACIALPLPTHGSATSGDSRANDS